MDEEELAGLAASIKSTGLIQPIAVRRSAQRAGAYEIVAGERRWRAARMAGLARVPAVVVELSEREAAEWAIVENVQRSDLNAMERAHAYKRLAAMFTLTHEEIARRIGVDRTSVANFIRLTELDERIQFMIATGNLSVGHAKALLSVENARVRYMLAEQALEQGLSVRKLEALCKHAATLQDPAAREALRTRVTARTASEAARKDMEKQLSDHLGARVSIRTDKTGKRGSVVVRFHDLDHFDGVLQRMGWRGEG